METSSPTDLSQIADEGAVTVSEGRKLCSRSCTVCRNPTMCVCTPQPASAPPSTSAHSAVKPRRRRPVPRCQWTPDASREEEAASADQGRPEEPPPSAASTSTSDVSQLQLRRQLFKVDTAHNLGESSYVVDDRPGPSRVVEESPSQSTDEEEEEDEDAESDEEEEEEEEEEEDTAGDDGDNTHSARGKKPSGIRHPCPRCTKTFGSPGKLSQHMYSHTGERPFVCQHCSKAFSSKFKLVRHALIHSDLRQYTCSMCERTFHRKDHLKNHAKVHSPVKYMYSCNREGCGKEYSSLLSYRKHSAVHAADDGNLECTMCGLQFANKDEIVFHLKVHAGSRTVKTAEDRKYRCERCDRSFFTLKDVRRHMVVHTGKRDFLCQFCPQRFGRKDHLVRHIKKSHTSAGKKAKSKRAEMKTKSVRSILVETGRVKEETVTSTSTTCDDQRAANVGDMVPCAFPSAGDSAVKEVATTATAHGNILSQPGTSIVFDAPQSVQDSGQFSAMIGPFDLDDIKVEEPAFIDIEDIKPDEEQLSEMIAIEQLPLLMLQQPQPQQQFLAPDEAQHISRHIMNLTSPGVSSDSELIIPLPSYLTTTAATADHHLASASLSATPSNTTPLPRFNQAFQQQPP